MGKIINGVEYTTFEDLWDSCTLTQAEKDEIQLRVDLHGALIEARNKKGMTQARLAELSGLKQPAIARLERMHNTPKIDTLFKVLAPLGYKLAIVPDDTRRNAPPISPP
ncbi:transcriptional regulator [Clostridia bacterium]|nr:transcriptional regulator [Clostridia bacterium]